MVLKQIVARNAAALDNPAELIERLDLDLAHPLSCQIEVKRDILQRTRRQRQDRNAVR